MTRIIHAHQYYKCKANNQSVFTAALQHEKIGFNHAPPRLQVFIALDVVLTEVHAGINAFENAESNIGSHDARWPAQVCYRGASRHVC